MSLDDGANLIDKHDDKENVPLIDIGTHPKAPLTTMPSVVVSHHTLSADDEDEGDDDSDDGSMESMKRNLAVYGSMFDVGSSHDILEELIGKDAHEIGMDIDPAVDLVPRPPDGGYGWIIVLCAFLCNMVFDGCCYGFGVILPAIQAHYGSSNSAATFAGALCTCVLNMEGPIISGLVNTFGARKVSSAGVLVGAVGVMASAFAPSLPVFIAAYSVIGGAGFGMVGTYFETKRALATGISVAGSGAGTFIMSPVFAYLIKEYHLRGTLIVQALMMSVCIIFTLLLKPLPPPKKAVELKLKLAETEQKLKHALSQIEINDDDKISFIQRPIGRSVAPSVNSLPRSSSRMRSRTGSITRPELNKLMRLRSVLSGSHVSHVNVGGRLSSDSDDATSPTAMHAPSVSRQQSSTDNAPMSRQVSSQDNGFGLRLRPQLQSQPSRDNRMSAAQYGRNLSRIASTVNGIQTAQSIVDVATIDPTDFSRPMARQDVLLSQFSIRHLPEYSAAHKDMNAYRQQQISVLGAPGGGGDDVYESIQGDDRIDSPAKTSIFPPSLARIIAEMSDVSLLRHRGFVIICVTQILAFLGFYIPFVFIGSRASANGAEVTAAALLLSYMGMANTIGRVASGWVADRQWTSALNITSIALIVTGLCSIVLTITESYVASVVYAIVFGGVIAAFISLTSVVLVEQVGLERLTNAYGLLCVARGIALFFGSPLGGLMYDVTNDFNVVFSLSGILFVAAGSIGCALHIVESSSGAEADLRAQTAKLLINGPRADATDSYVPQLAPLTEEISVEEKVESKMMIDDQPMPELRIINETDPNA